MTDPTPKSNAGMLTNGLHQLMESVNPVDFVNLTKLTLAEHATDRQSFDNVVVGYDDAIKMAWNCRRVSKAQELQALGFISKALVMSKSNDLVTRSFARQEAIRAAEYMEQSIRYRGHYNDIP